MNSGDSYDWEEFSDSSDAEGNDAPFVQGEGLNDALQDWWIGQLGSEAAGSLFDEAAMACNEGKLEPNDAYEWIRDQMKERIFKSEDDQEVEQEESEDMEDEITEQGEESGECYVWSDESRVFERIIDGVVVGYVVNGSELEGQLLGRVRRVKAQESLKEREERKREEEDEDLEDGEVGEEYWEEDEDGEGTD